MVDTGSESEHARTRVWMIAGLAVVVLSLYMRAIAFEFTNWDEKRFVDENSLVQTVSAHNIAHILAGDIEGELLYVPLTYLSFMLESDLTWRRSRTTHFTNVLLHLLNTFLVFRLCLRLGRDVRIGFFAALLFAAHPLQVEAVASVVGRKDLLAAGFSLLALSAWHRFLMDGRRQGMVALALITFTAACLSKPSAIMLPALLLLLSAGVCGRPERRHWFALLPFVVVAVLVYLTNRGLAGGGGLEPGRMLRMLPLLPVVVGGWLARFALVEPVSVFYTLSTAVAMSGAALGLYLIPVLLLLGGLAWSVRRRYRFVWLGLGFASIAMLPALALSLSASREFITGDRYSYFPIIGVCFVVASLPWQLRRPYRQLGAVLLSVFAATAAILAWPQIGVWRDSGTLWRAALTRDPNNYVAWNGLGNWHYDSGRRDEALGCYERAAQLGHKGAAHNVVFTCLTRAEELMDNDREREAVPFLEHALRFSGNRAQTGEILARLSQVWLRLDDVERARHYRDRARALGASVHPDASEP